MALRTPSNQTRSQYARDWGNYSTIAECPNAASFAGSTNKISGVLEVGDTAWVTGVGRVFCRSTGTPGALDAVWGTGVDAFALRGVGDGVDGTAAVILGAVYLQAGMTLTTDSRALVGTTAGGTGTVQLRREGTGALLPGASWASTGAGLSSVALGAAVSVASTDWYTIEMVGDVVGTIPLVYGLRLVR